MRRMIVIAGALLLALAGYLAFWPVPVAPVAWQAPVFGGYIGPHAVNERLAAVEILSVAPEVGPEHVEFGPDGKLYTGVLSGAILRMNPDGTGIETVANTGGRPLGFAFDAEGRLVVADAMKGLIAINANREIAVLADEVDGDPIRYADAVVIAVDGRMFFTDASRRFLPSELGTFDAAVFDVLEHSCTGRVLEFDPASRQTTVVIENLCFPNGVALSGDERYLFVAETGEYRIWKVEAAARGLDARAAVSGNDSRARVIAANLPGFPDNLTRSAEGRLWTGLNKPRSPAVDRLASWPRLRAVTLRLPRAVWPVPPSYGHVIAFDENGRVVADLQDPAGRLAETSGVTEFDGHLYVHSLHAPALGVLAGAAASP
jgi:sugar lactone lactonase YvrE